MRQSMNMTLPADNIQEPLAVGKSTSDLAISTYGLTKHFGPQVAVESLSIGIPRGVTAGFVGPNGAGKTTTIRLLLGLLRPTAGSATVLGADIGHPEAYLPRVGALIEGPSFYPNLSGRQNLEVLATLGGHLHSRVKQVLEVVGLSDRAEDPVKSYSLGMKQRLGVATALLPDPELLILDEPANGLDPAGIIQIRDLMRELRDHGKTIFISSHLLGELEQVADWLVMLNHGRAVFTGSPQELVGGHSELVVAAEEPAQLESVAKLATKAGYAVTRENDTLRITCPPSFAAELNRQAMQAGITLVELHHSQASLEEGYLALLRGGH
ncbi:MAG: ABC transporter ATP-binding protein [Ktedonobacterales bacterium]